MFDIILIKLFSEPLSLDVAFVILKRPLTLGVNCFIKN